MLSRHKRPPVVLEDLADSVFHQHASRWRPLSEVLRMRVKPDPDKPRYMADSARKARLPLHWSPWLWVK